MADTLAKVEAMLNRINWRMAFIFVPAIVRGEWRSAGLYAPFLFSYVLSAARTELFRATSEGIFAAPRATAMALAQGLGFAAFSYYFEAEGRYLTTFLFSSFLCPVVRHYCPKFGDHIVYTLVVLGLSYAWLFQGLDAMFWGILFLQGVPEVQRHLWQKPDRNIMCIATVFLVTLPFTGLGFIAYWMPSYLDYLPLAFLQLLCLLANAKPPNYYAILGLANNATKAEISSTYHKLALQYHPDKIPVSVSDAERALLTEKFTKIGEANTMLRETSAGVAELTELRPRCAAALFLCFYWVLHMMMDFLEIEKSKERAKEQLREAIINNSQETMPLNLAALGVEDRQTVQDYCKDNNRYYGVPLVQKNNLQDILDMREYLQAGGVELKPLPAGLKEDEPLFLPRPPQLPGWVQWLQMPEQASNVLALAFSGNTDGLIEAIRERGQSPHTSISPGNRGAVYLAAMNGHSDCIKALAGFRADVRYPDENGISPMHMACKDGHVQAVETLLGCGAEINQAAKNGITPLHVASVEGHVPVVELLLTKKANVNATQPGGETPLFLAAHLNKTAVVTLLVERGKANVNAANHLASPIWLAAMSGNISMASTLHQLGGDTSLCSSDSVDPAKFACKDVCTACTAAGNTDMAKMLTLMDSLAAKKKEIKKAGLMAVVKKDAHEQARCAEQLKDTTAKLDQLYADTQAAEAVDAAAKKNN